MLESSYPGDMSVPQIENVIDKYILPNCRGTAHGVLVEERLKKWIPFKITAVQPSDIIKYMLHNELIVERVNNPNSYEITLKGRYFIGFKNERKKYKRDSNPEWYNIKVGLIIGILTLAASTGVKIWLDRKEYRLQEQQGEHYRSLEKKVDSLTNLPLFHQKSDSAKEN
jgi:hypothetical protein